MRVEFRVTRDQYGLRGVRGLCGTQYIENLVHRGTEITVRHEASRVDGEEKMTEIEGLVGRQVSIADRRKRCASQGTDDRKSTV